MEDEAGLRISGRVSIPRSEIEITAVRAQGAGGQNVNKLSTAAHLRFDISASSLPDPYKQRLLILEDGRITRAGVVVIKAQTHRSLEQNREEALGRLQRLVRQAAVTRKRRIPTRPTTASRNKRLEQKNRQGNLKRLRGRVID